MILIILAFFVTAIVLVLCVISYDCDHFGHFCDRDAVIYVIHSSSKIISNKFKKFVHEIDSLPAVHQKVLDRFQYTSP